MKILYLCADLGVPVLGRKGASVHVREFSAALARAGHDVVVAASQLTRSAWEEPAQMDVPVLYVEPSVRTTSLFTQLKARAERFGVASAPASGVRRILYDDELRDELRRRVAHDPPELLFERASLHGTAGAALADELGIPFLVEVNAPLGLEQDTYRGDALATLAAAAERQTLRRADAVFAVSESLRAYAASLGVEDARLHVLPNAIDPQRFYPAEADPKTGTRLGLDSGPVLGFVGGLRAWHGVGALPELVARLGTTHPNVRLVVAGDGPGRAELQRRFHDAEVADRVVFTGSLAHDEVPAVLRRLDVALVPYEPLEHAFYFSPLKLFEAMACGVPVVAARIGQIGDVVRDGETGLLYEPGDDAALLAACERLLADADLRRRIGLAAADAVRREHTWDRNADRVLQVAARLAR
jgi:glycosyltransferase involved in cell wall biosynthesis